MALVLTVAMTVGLLSGGGSSATSDSTAEKVFNYGTVAYGVANSNVGLNPHEAYSGWSTVRYGVGETLFKFNEAMELEPWLATDFQQIDDYTVKINLRDDVTFSNGKKMTGDSVKACLENLIAVHDRAPKDLQIKSITAEGSFPANFSFGGDAVKAAAYDIEGAKAVLEAAGWVDSNGLKLSDCTFVCPHCGHTMDRDWQAAVNILHEGLRCYQHSLTTA